MGRESVLGYEAVSRLIRRQGESVVFAMVGGTNAPWVAAGVRSGDITLVRTRHEATAVAAAAGRARITGRPAVSTVSKGPGFSNALTALRSAARGHVPVIVLVAESPSRLGANAQDLDQRTATEVAGAGFVHVESATELPARLDEAFAAARWNGLPQVVSLAQSGVMDAEVTWDEAFEPTSVRGPDVDLAAIARAVDVLQSSACPLVLAGQGSVLGAGGAELVQLAETLGARLSTTILANGLFDGHPANVGLCGGWATAERRQELRRTDALITFGASLNPNTMGGEGGYLFGDAPIVQCDVDKRAFGRYVDPEVAVLGDVRAVVKSVLAEWDRRGLERRPAPSAGEGAGLREGVLGDAVRNDALAVLEPRIVYAELDRRLPRTRTIVSDGGRSLPTLPSLIRAHDHRGFIATNAYGSIGLGLGTALGVASANGPGRRTFLVCGDSGLMMTIQELDAVRLAGLDLTVIVLNDGQSGAEIRYLEKYALPLDVVRQETPDLVALARAHGGDGCVVTTLEELRSVDLERPGIWMLDVRTNPEVETRGSVGIASERAAGMVP